jgi:preflagellin peptidase FlaK
VFIRDLDANPTVQSSLVFGIATDPDLVRLLAVPVFAWAAYRDLRTRRVPNRIWLPLVAVGVLALAWELFVFVDGGLERRLFLTRTALSLGFVAPLGYLFWRLGGFGGADAKAIITFAVLFPVYPMYYVFGGAYPLHHAPLGVFSLTILSNTVLVGLLYPFALAVRNLPRGEFTLAMFVGRPVSIEAIVSEYGRLLETTEGFTRRGLDIDALRMYLRWRGVSLSAIRESPESYRTSVPAEPNEPGDGAIDDGIDGFGGDTEPIEGDPWGAEAFLSDHAAYGTTPEQLREGLSLLSATDRETVWITPGIPFIVPMFVGLLVALTFGDLLFWILSSLGLGVGVGL